MSIPSLTYVYKFSVRVSMYLLIVLVGRNCINILRQFIISNVTQFLSHDHLLVDHMIGKLEIAVSEFQLTATCSSVKMTEPTDL